MENDENDLSEYEKLRLLNIQKNNDFLKSLGLINNIQQSPSITSSERNKEKKKKSWDEAPVNERFSKRIRGQVPDTESLSGENKVQTLIEKEEVPFYDIIPETSEQLDNFEFQVLVELKKWRLKLCRSLEVEPYKIFQNRTLCEMIRRRRNNKEWGMKILENQQNINNASDGNQAIITSSDDKVRDDLRDCWGVGPVKIQPAGFAWEALDILNLKIVEDLLVQSRALTCP